MRSARAIAGLSQRDLARRVGISKSALARVETDVDGNRTTVRMFTRLLAACGVELIPRGAKGRLMPDGDPERDAQGRRYPPHLDPYAPMCREDWWATVFVYQGIVDRLVPWPARTFALDPYRRAQRRADATHPWDARFWEVSVSRAPAFTVHPELERRRALHAVSGRAPRTAATPSELRRWGWHWVEGSPMRPKP